MPNSLTIIGRGTIINGRIEGEENLKIEGKIEGEILVNDTVIVEEGGKVFANVNASIVFVNGIVAGNIRASSKVVISKSGKVIGDIVSPLVVLDDGAKFKGNIDMGDIESRWKTTQDLKKIEQKEVTPQKVPLFQSKIRVPVIKREPIVEVRGIHPIKENKEVREASSLVRSYSESSFTNTKVGVKEETKESLVAQPKEEVTPLTEKEEETTQKQVPSLKKEEGVSLKESLSMDEKEGVELGSKEVVSEGEVIEEKSEEVAEESSKELEAQKKKKIVVKKRTPRGKI